MEASQLQSFDNFFWLQACTAVVAKSKFLGAGTEGTELLSYIMQTAFDSVRHCCAISLSCTLDARRCVNVVWSDMLTCEIYTVPLLFHFMWVTG